MSEGVSDDYVQSVEIDVVGVPPKPVIVPGPPGTVGSTITADGSESYSPEELPLTFMWSLVTQPNSTAALSSTTMPTTSFIADVAGTYTLQLLVFDGELKSDPAAMAVIQVDP
jgi:hypothetical protein